MTGLDARLIPKVKKILAKYGKTVTITMPGIAVYSVRDGVVDAAGETDQTIKITPPEPWTLAPLPDSTVEAGDMSAYSGTDVVPDVGMKVSFDGQIWTVMAVGRVYTGDLVAMYLLQLRA